MDEISTLGLDRETSTRLALDQLVSELYHFTGDLYYEAQDAHKDGECPPEELQRVYAYADKVTYFYKQCLEMQRMLKERV